jgi:Mrp family chromosome partitioning ATPase
VSNFLSGHGGTITDYLEQVNVQRTRKNGHGPSAALSGDLTVVPAGPVPPNPQGLLTSASLDSLLAQARTYGDKVVIDGTPLGPFSDMLPVAKRADGVILVIRLYHSRRDEVARLMEALDQANIRPLGVVLYGAETIHSGHYYSHGS